MRRREYLLNQIDSENYDRFDICLKPKYTSVFDRTSSTDRSELIFKTMEKSDYFFIIHIHIGEGEGPMAFYMDT